MRPSLFVFATTSRSLDRFRKVQISGFTEKTPLNFRKSPEVLRVVHSKCSWAHNQPSNSDSRQTQNTLRSHIHLTRKDGEVWRNSARGNTMFSLLWLFYLFLISVVVAFFTYALFFRKVSQIKPHSNCISSQRDSELFSRSKITWSAECSMQPEFL